MASLRILGIDPGLNVTGYGLIEVASHRQPEVLLYGVIRSRGRQQLSERLQKIFSELNTLIKSEQPDVLAIEDIFYADNVKTAIIMGHARGAAMIAATVNNVPVAEYTAREIKQSVVGNGAAAKTQVKFMVRNLLRIEQDIKPDDASDALAVALCHWHRVERG